MADGVAHTVERALAAAALLVAAPVVCVAALGVKLSSPGPALFSQQRVGRHGRPFRFFKLRTMTVGDTGDRVTSGGDRRVTALGRLLRKSKIDELPELWHIVTGDMSFVGPRPEVPAFVDLTDSRWQRVLQARPGLTDPVTLRLRNEEELLAQITGDRERFYREELLSWKLRGYAAYLDRRTWRSDVVVIAKTALAVILPGMAEPPTLDEVRAP